MTDYDYKEGDTMMLMIDPTKPFTKLLFLELCTLVESEKSSRTRKLFTITSILDTHKTYTHG